MFDINDYDKYKFDAIKSRYFNYQIVINQYQLFKNSIAKEIGKSFLGNPIFLYKLGSGNNIILMWSQMHGDESTATAALFDLINFLTANNDKYSSVRNKILAECTIYLLPVLNPDGLKSFTRNNAQNIDINRDYLKGVSPEANLLKQLYNDIKPDFCFNLHDQNPWYGTKNKREMVAMAFLAPPINDKNEVCWNREQAMKLISGTVQHLKAYIPNNIARFKDEFEPRAFGDQFQKQGAITVLIESGWIINDEEKQEVRKFTFLSILAALENISNQNFQEQELLHYLMLPLNEQNHFHLLIKNVEIISENGNYFVDIGLNYKEFLSSDEAHLQKKWWVEEMGDLQNFRAHEIGEAPHLSTDKLIEIKENVNLSIVNADGKIIFHFVNGDKIL